MTGLVLLDVWHDPSSLHLARPVADMIRAAGAVPRLRTNRQPPKDADAIIVLLGSSPNAQCWVDGSWIDAVYQPAVAAKVPVMPICIEDCAVPDVLSHLSYADFINRDRAGEELRFLITLAGMFGDDRISVPKLETDVPTSPPHHAIRLRYGAALAQWINQRFVTEGLPMMQDGLYHELGVPYPDVHLELDPALSMVGFAIDLFDFEEVAESIPEGHVFVNLHPDELTNAGIPCQPAKNPASGHAHAWVHESLAERLLAKAYTTWDPGGWMILRLSALLRYRASTFLDQRVVNAMLDTLRPHFPRLVETTVPGALSLADFTDVLRRLVFEGVGVRDLRRILIEIAEIAAYEDRPDIVVDYLRSALKSLITHLAARGQGHVVVVLIDPEFEERLLAATEWGVTSSWIALDKGDLAPILSGLEELMAGFGPGVQPPVILTGLELRAAMRRLIAPSFPTIHAIAYNDLDPTITIQPIGRIGPDGVTRRSGVSVPKAEL